MMAVELLEKYAVKHKDMLEFSFNEFKKMAGPSYG